VRRHWKYILYVLRHKWHVFWAGIWLGVDPVSLLLHDWDKFLPGMWRAYASTFYAPDGTKQYKPGAAFERGWNAHEKRNKHHWQYWLLTWDSGKTTALDMPLRHRREMLADWIGAGRALGKPFTWEWYAANKDKLHLHPDTRAWIEQRLDDMWQEHRISTIAGG
jgi:hypothetical protein